MECLIEEDKWGTLVRPARAETPHDNYGEPIPWSIRPGWGCAVTTVRRNRLIKRRVSLSAKEQGKTRRSSPVLFYDARSGQRLLRHDQAILVGVKIIAGPEGHAGEAYRDVPLAGIALDGLERMHPSALTPMLMSLIAAESRMQPFTTTPAQLLVSASSAS